MARLRPTSWFEVLAWTLAEPTGMRMGTFFVLAFILPFHGYSCMRKANPTRVGWGVGECSCTCGLLARSGQRRCRAACSRLRRKYTRIHTCRHVLLRVNRPSDPSFKMCGMLHASRAL